MEIDTGSRKVVDPVSFRDKTALFITRMNKIIRERSDENAIPVVDLYAGFIKKNGTDILDPQYAIGDNAHLNIDGQKKIADILMNEYFLVGEDFDVVVCLGDSHTQGFPVRNDTSRNGIPVDMDADSPHQYPYWMSRSTSKTFINRGIAGNTFYGMLKRFDKEVVPHFPDHCIIQGGTNDALLGTPLEESQNDLFQIVDKCIKNNITPVVCTIIPLGF
jgi:lysophospholipase L1-like esterase